MWNCTENSFECRSKPGHCIKEYMVCDQISQCPNAEDAVGCEKYFPPSATWPCTKPNTANNIYITIPIMATPCNSVVECDDGSDELDCPSTIKYTLITYQLGDIEHPNNENSQNIDD